MNRLNKQENYRKEEKKKCDNVYQPGNMHFYFFSGIQAELAIQANLANLPNFPAKFAKFCQNLNCLKFVKILN